MKVDSVAILGAVDTDDGADCGLGDSLCSEVIVPSVRSWFECSLNRKSDSTARVAVYFVTRSLASLSASQFPLFLQHVPPGHTPYHAPH